MAMAVVVLTLGAPRAAYADAATAPCADADVYVEAAGVTAARRAARCLINAERRAQGLRALGYDRELSIAAERHANDMVRRRFFSHVSPGGRTFVERIVAATESGSWLWSGEVLAWGCRSAGTARGTVEGWMNSPPHRAIVLARQPRAIGIGAAVGLPNRRGCPGATWAAELGRKLD